MSGLDPQTLDPLIRHALERAVRARLRDIESMHADDHRRLVAKRASLDLLRFAVKEGGTVDGLQIRVLMELLDSQARELDERALPFWPGGQYAFLVKVLDEKFAIDEARKALRDALDELRTKDDSEDEWERTHHATHGARHSSWDRR